MKKYSGPEELYKELVDESEESWIFGLVSFALIEQQRIEWMRHQEKHNGALPQHNEITSWYEQLPLGSILRAKGEAESALNAYSEEVLDEYLEEHQAEIEEDIIVSEIREIKAFWPQFGVNLAGGIASSILFAGLIILLAFFILSDTSPSKIGSDLRQNFEENKNG